MKSATGVRYDSVVFADTASLAALSCFARLQAEAAAGRRSILVALEDSSGADVIKERGLADVRRIEEFESEGSTGQPLPSWRERLSAVIRRFDPKHVMAPLGLLGAPQHVDYFSVVRAALSVDRGRDLLFFEERPHCLVQESVALRLSAIGVRLPPASPLRASRLHAPFSFRLLTGLGVPPIFGGFKERFRLSGSLKQAFREAADWDPQRALGPKLQPVTQTWSDGDTQRLYALAADLGQGTSLGSAKTFARRMARHAASAGRKSPMERCWLSLPGEAATDPISDGY